MGGNVVIDAQGKVGLLHYSKVPQDRPTVEQLLTTLKVCIYLQKYWCTLFYLTYDILI